MAIERFDDLRARSRLGGVFYALSWLIIAAFGGAFAAYPLGSLLALALLAGLAVWRLRIPAARTAEDALRRERRLWQVILGSAALFGALATWALLDPAFRGVEIAILLCVISLGTAFAHVYAIDRRRALLGTGLISLPALFAEAVAGEHAVVTLVMASTASTSSASSARATASTGPASRSRRRCGVSATASRRRRAPMP
jgi:4-hydroxybenzoate polyprenyltransferase